MNTRLLTVHDIQGAMIHRMLGRRAKADRHEPVTLRDYQQAHAKALRPGFVVHQSKLPLLMGVNFGRWCGLCPECGAGVMMDRRWPEARCFSCGATFEHIIWPDDPDGVEKVLLARPLQNQNCLPGETVQMLVVENVRHRVRMGRGLR